MKFYFFKIFGIILLNLYFVSNLRLKFKEEVKTKEEYQIEIFIDNKLKAKDFIIHFVENNID